MGRKNSPSANKELNELIAQYETAKAEAESITLMYEDYGGTDDEIHKLLHKEFPKATCEEIEDMMFDNRKAILKYKK